MNALFDTLVIGAGQAGLAAGYHLQRMGAHFRILESSANPGGSWAQYYQSLHLFSPARFSALPGLAFPGDPERYPSRDEVTNYLQQYAAHFQLPIETSTRVEAINRTSQGFEVNISDGRMYQARSIIAATGSYHRPFLPSLPAQEHYRGTLLHSVSYATPEPFRGQRVVVVGGGNSAIQIATELAKVATVSLATRTPLRFVRQRPYNRDIHFWWSLLKLDTSPTGSLRSRFLELIAAGAGPLVLDDGRYQAALATGAPDVRPMFERFTEQGIRWASGQEEPVDTIIFATGYRPNLGYLAPLGALREDGQPMHRYGLSTAVSGLGFVGITDQRTMASATLRGVGPDAAFVLQALASQLGKPAPAKPHAWWRMWCCPSSGTTSA